MFEALTSSALPSLTSITTCLPLPFPVGQHQETVNEEDWPHDAQGRQHHARLARRPGRRRARADARVSHSCPQELAASAVMRCGAPETVHGTPCVFFCLTARAPAWSCRRPRAQAVRKRPGRAALPSCRIPSIQLSQEKNYTSCEASMHPGLLVLSLF